MRNNYLKISINIIKIVSILPLWTKIIIEVQCMPTGYWNVVPNLIYPQLLQNLKFIPFQLKICKIFITISLLPTTFLETITEVFQIKITLVAPPSTPSAPKAYYSIKIYSRQSLKSDKKTTTLTATSPNLSATSPTLESSTNRKKSTV